MANSAGRHLLVFDYSNVQFMEQVAIHTTGTLPFNAVGVGSRAVSHDCDFPLILLLLWIQNLSIHTKHTQAK